MPRVHAQVDLRELEFAIKALGFSEAQQRHILTEADRSGGGALGARLDGEARLSGEQVCVAVLHLTPLQVPISGNGRPHYMNSTFAVRARSLMDAMPMSRDAETPRLDHLAVTP